jgi:hypothetical protein
LSERGGKVERVGEILKRVMREKGLDRPERHAEIGEAWRDVAGPDVAGDTGIGSFKGGVLTINVSSAPLLSELVTFQKEELLAALRARLEGTFIRELRFQLR